FPSLSSFPSPSSSSPASSSSPPQSVPPRASQAHPPSSPLFSSPRFLHRCPHSASFPSSRLQQRRRNLHQAQHQQLLLQSARWFLPRLQLQQPASPSSSPSCRP
ncbi:hypothetical protein PENTCL1PPCAC_10015, partial [Pristionchus entomophagus]